MENATICSMHADDTFGPAVTAQCRNFDFTLLFEETMLSMVPSILFMFAAVGRMVSLSGRNTMMGGHRFRMIKMACVIILGAIQLAVLVLWCFASSKTRTSIASAAITVANSLVLLLLSPVEHMKSLRPSMLLGAYLFFSIIFDVAHARTLWLLRSEHTIAIVFTVALAVKVLLMIFEAKGKISYLKSPAIQVSPEESCGMFSHSLLLWLNPLIRFGYKHILLLDNLFILDRHLTSEMVHSKLRKAWINSSRRGNHALLVCIFRALKTPIAIPIVPRLISCALTLTQPLFIARVISFLQQNHDERTRDTGYGLIGACALIYVGIAISSAMYEYHLYRSISMIRSSLISMIYEKVTKTELSTIEDSVALTLLTADVERIVNASKLMHEIWASVVEIAIAAWLLYIQIGLAFLAPILLTIVSTVAVLKVSMLVGPKQLIWLKAIQKRINESTKMLDSMGKIKVLGLSQKLSDIIQNLRVAELDAAFQFRMLLVATLTLAYIPITLSALLSFASFIPIANSNGTTLGTERLFTTLSILTILTTPLNRILQGLPQVFSAIGCVDRIQGFLLNDNRADYRSGSIVVATAEMSEPNSNSKSLQTTTLEKSQSLESSDSYSIAMEHGSFGWKREGDPILKNLNFSFQSSQLVMIVGPVASGKSTMLQSILGETYCLDGYVHIRDQNIAFCGQKPWLINSTIRENILGFSPFDTTWYTMVVVACALDDDISQLPDGDLSMVGANGVSLSGGQKQRLALARAVYARKDIVILDDILSGLDEVTQTRLFERLLSPKGLLRQAKSTIILATHAARFLSYADHIVALSENGEISQQGSFEQLIAEDGYIRSIAQEHYISLHQSVDDRTSTWKPEMNSNIGKEASEASQDTSRGSGNFALYKLYLKSVGSVTVCFFICLQVAFTVLLRFPEIWLKWWADKNNNTPNSRNTFYLGIYSVFQVCALLTLSTLSWLLFTHFAVNSGKSLHFTLLKTVMRAPLAYFSKTDTGSIANRFSQDIQILDVELPLSVLNVAANALGTIGMMCLIATGSYWLVISYVPLALIFFAIQRLYLRTSRQLRLLDLETKAPLYSHFTETITGLATVRAFRWEQEVQTKASRLLDSSQKPFHLLFCVQRWLGLVLDLVTAALAIILVSVMIEVRNPALVGFSGVALVNLMNLSGSFTAVISMWTGMETSIGAISRIQKFESDTPKEPVLDEPFFPGEDWPAKGRVEISHLSASYGQNEPNVLKDITFTIEEGEKIGICGRTGSGKSSLILALLQLIPVSEGSITIDGVDLSSVSRDVLRSRICVVTQDPYFFSGSVRANLDPFDRASEPEMVKVLEIVQLWTLIEEHGGLNADMDTELLSYGQKQLFCLARGILRGGKIVILDEVTANLDHHTAVQVQGLIREYLKDSTLITITHRLDSIMETNRIYVFDQGSVVESGSPTVILSRSSIFKELVKVEDDTGDNGS